MYNLKIEKLIFGGQGLAHVDGKVVFVWNALPGEVVDVEIIKKKKDYLEGIAVNIVEASPERVEPKDKHFLSTSPWQIMSYEIENKWKKEISVETYKKLGGEVFADIDPEIIFPKEEYGYRNKMEFSFYEVGDYLTPDPSPCHRLSGVPPHRRHKGEGKFRLAFFDRGKKSKFPIEKSELAEPIINKTAGEVLDWVNRQNLERRNLKTLIVRSDGQGNSISALFVKDKLKFDNYPKLNKNNLGFQIYYSTHKCPASVPTKLLYSNGQDFLVADLLGTKLKFGLLSFFQVHIPIFTKALQDIIEHVGIEKSVVDFYSGVGSIGLPLAQNQNQVILVDNSEEAIEYAKENIEMLKNDLTPTPLLATASAGFRHTGDIKERDLQAHCIPAEKMTRVITKDKAIILDPPRSGLHENVTKKLLEVEPPKIVYLSCNLSTQARDVKMLSERYRIAFCRLYNFFPRTPHVEGLVVLELKQS